MDVHSVETVFGGRQKSDLAARKFAAVKQVLVAWRQSGKPALSLDILARHASRHVSGKITTGAFAEFLRSGLMPEQRRALEDLGLPRTSQEKTAPKEPKVVYKTKEQISLAYKRALANLPPEQRTIPNLAQALNIAPYAVASYCRENPAFGSGVIGFADLP